LQAYYEWNISGKKCVMYKLNIRSPKYLILIAAIIVVVILVVLKSVGIIDLRSREIKQVDRGRELSHIYCKSCHEYPEPSLIDKQTWVKRVLPEMAKQFKLESFFGKYGVTPLSTIAPADFEDIIAFYKKEAPEKLLSPKSPSVSDWAIFSLEKPKNVSRAEGDDANTTLLAYNPNDKKLYSGDMRNNFYRWNENLEPSLVAKMSTPAVGANFYSNATGKNLALITCIGILNPNDLLKGSIANIDLEKNGATPGVVADSLPRPVQTISADFNKDGLLDYVTCGFGRNVGGLYLFTQQKDHHYKKTVIRAAPGSEQMVTGDFNNDGYPDLMCLFAQADEGIWLFLNDNKGGFIAKNILHFPPIYGSSSFQLVDFNHDGKPDILYTCGDNSDLSPVLKPYHGVYIFTNQGNWQFKQTFFYHIDGSTKAMAADFDHDGDLDIATIAYFPDFRDDPKEGFVYLEQTMPNQFKAHEIPVSDEGRWLTMEVADLDNDGYPDVILGNFSVPGRDLMNQAGVEKKWDKFTPFIVLKNNAAKLRDKSAPISK